MEVQHYILRAIDFYNGMQLIRYDAPYRNSAALLAIHSAISYTDALRVGLGDDRLTGDNHQQATKSLRRLLAVDETTDQEGLRHFEYLVSHKSQIAYGDERLTENELRRLIIKAERFAKWANGVGKQRSIKGWQNDD